MYRTTNLLKIMWMAIS